MPQRAAIRVAFVAAVCAIAALFVARFAITSPSIWPLAPESWLRLLQSLLQPQGQEAVADVEFFGFWLLAFLAFATLSFFIWLARHLRTRTAPHTHR